MKDLMMIAKSNILKRKNNVILIFVLTAIATMLLYTSVNVITDVNRFLDKRNMEQNGADVMFVCSTGYESKVGDIFKKGSGFYTYEKEETLEMVSSKIKNTTINSKDENYGFIIYDVNNTRSISDLEIKDKAEKLKENSIVLPAYFNISCGYSVGDRVEITNGDKKYSFDVYGFAEDVMFSNPSNLSMFKLFINTNSYNSIKETDQSAVIQDSYNIKLKDGHSTKDYENYTTASFTKEIKDANFHFDIGINYEIMKKGTSIFVNIMMAIIAVFALIIIIVSIIVISFSINTTIESDIKNIGILEAVGYTTRQLKNATIIEYMLISIIGSICGLLLSIIANNFIAKLVSSIMGLYWNPEINILLIILSILLMNSIVFVVVNVCAYKYKKITPLVALRNGFENHNFKKNHLSLDKSIFGLNSSLGLKEMLFNKKQNISMAIIVMLLTFTSIVAMGIYYNFTVNQEALMNIIGMEKPDIKIVPADVANTNIEHLQKVYDDISNRNDVNNSLYYTHQQANLINEDKNMSLSLEVVSKIDQLKINTIISGREVKYDNEIMLTNVVLNNLGAKLGDTIYVESLGGKQDFIIVGVTQQIVQVGIGGKVTEEGMKRISGDFKGTTLYVYLNKDSNTEEVIRNLNSVYKDEALSIINFEKMYDTVLASFNNGIAILSLVSLLVTILIITLILFMLIKIKLIKDNKIYGVYKALGYKSNEIMWQITMNFAPVISIGVILGIILGVYLVNPVMVLSLNIAGIEKCSITVNPLICILTFVLITSLTIVISFISSRKVRKIEPCKIITEQ